MPRNKKKTARSSSSTSSASSSSSTSSTSSSSSDSDNTARKNKRLRHQVQTLKRKLSDKSSVYQGKIDSVVAFSGSFDEVMNARLWLNSIDATGDLFGWDERARIYCMINKLRGNAKTWYSNQESVHLSWKEWKNKLQESFPEQQCVFRKLKDLVNNERNESQNLIDFFYQKLSLGQYCKLQDKVIVDIITNTINDPFLKSGIRAAGCIQPPNRNQLQGGNVTMVHETWKKVNALHLDALRVSGTTNTSAQSLTIKAGISSGPLVNLGLIFLSDLSTSNSENTVSEKLFRDDWSMLSLLSLGPVYAVRKNLQNINNRLGIITPLGQIKTNIDIDEISITAEFFVVPDTVQTTDLLIGQPITECDGVYVYKTSEYLKLTERNIILPWDAIEENSVVKINTLERTVLKPGINVIAVTSDLINCELRTLHSEQNRNGTTVIIPSNEIQFCHGTGMMSILNLGLQTIEVDKNTCLARGSRNNIDDEIDNRVNSQININVKRLIEQYPECFDRGKAFDCREFKQFCENHSINHVKNAIASPRSNGQVERTNRTILESLTATIEGGHDKWDRELVKVQRGINSTVNATTGMAPSELLYGFTPEMQNEVRLKKNRIDLKKARAEAKRRCDLAAKRMKKAYDRRRVDAKQYKVGDVVLVERKLLVKGLKSGKLVPKYIGPVQIVEVVGNDRYRVASFSKDKRRFKGIVASDRFRLFKPQLDSSPVCCNRSSEPEKLLE
ncbi:hypothetical protein NQ317_005316 [Molorchus minor]|uniref:Integrase catalytic domain-containing protein n=1 Tax=Molorchus minor TaxID=1323400 RepID=A0ABQ9K0V8_9CUCU|nr:hypothetical protein NQ317_005316 [Molorchus minor]